MSNPKVLNCSDIKTKLDGTNIAHITDGQLAFTHDPRVIFSNDTAPYEEDEPGKLTYQLTGNALIQMETGLSFASLITIMLARQKVQFEAVIGDSVSVSGEATLINLTGGGATEQNGTCSYTFKGSKLPVINGGTAADILTYSLAEQTGPAVIGDGTIAIEVANGTTVTALVATFTTSPDITSIKVGEVVQVSATTANDFTEPVTYAVIAEDGETTKEWVVTVTVAEAEEEE
jgi:hypothetical protein